MPTVRQQLTEKAIALLEASDDVKDDFTRIANRQASSKSAWLREMMANTPADFPRFLLDFARGSHSMYTAADAGFAGDDTSFHTSGIEFPVNRVFTLRITIRADKPKAGVVFAPEESIIAAFFVAGPRFGLPSLVYSVGECRYDRRDTRGDEKPQGGTVTTIELPITTQESGVTLLSA